MQPLLPDLERTLDDTARAWWRDACARCARDGVRALAVTLPALPRRLGRHVAGSGIVTHLGAHLDLSVWRICDAAAHHALAVARADDAAVLDLHAHGDMEERTMVLRATAARPLSPATARLLAEVQRSNVVPHFEALCCDSDLVARACGQVDGFAQDQCNRLLLKAAFLGLRLRRLFGSERHANPELSRMLQDLATEREAAGRPVWVDTDLLTARAPVPGTVARLLGNLEHGDDERRAAAIAGLALLRRHDLAPFLRERLPREQRPALQRALHAALATVS